MANHDASAVKKRRKWRLIKKDVTSLATRKRSRNIQLSLLADFLANHISAAGFSHVVKSPSPLRRKLWTVVIVITAISMIVMTYRVLQEYLEYSTIIRSKHKVLSELEFPAVTICSMSSIAKIFAKEANEDILMTITDYLNDLPKYNISEEDRIRCLKDPLCHWIWSLNVCKCYENPCQTSYCYKNISEDKCQCSEDMCEWKGSADACYLATDNNSMSKCTCSTNFTYPLAKLDQEFGDSNDDDDLYYMNETLEFNVVSELSRRFRNQRDFHDANPMPWNIVTKNKYGLPIDSIILGCSFAGSSCSDFKTLYTALGKCYMFNYVGEEATKLKKVETVSFPGKQHGLTLFMRSNSNDFLPFSARQLGVRIVIHDPRSLPIVQEDGIDLRSGDMSTISIEYKEIHRLGPPWGKCGQDGQKVGVYCQDPYKQNDCQQECINAEIYRQCFCYDPVFLRSTTIPGEKLLCGDMLGYCHLKLMSPDGLKMMNCSCPPACREKLYPLSLSSSKLNEDYFKLVKEVQSFRKVNGTPAIARSDFELDGASSRRTMWFQTTCIAVKGNLAIVKSDNMISSSLLGVQIFYSSMIITHLNETPIYSWESLVSNIGGNMGLFLGISLVTLLEVFEFLVDTIRNAFAKREKLPSRITPVIIS